MIARSLEARRAGSPEDNANKRFPEISDINNELLQLRDVRCQLGLSSTRQLLIVHNPSCPGGTIFIFRQFLRMATERREKRDQMLNFLLNGSCQKTEDFLLSLSVPSRGGRRKRQRRVMIYVITFSVARMWKFIIFFVSRWGMEGMWCHKI